MTTNKPHKKVEQQTNRRFTFKKAITKIKIMAGNQGKLEQLEAVAVEYQRVLRSYCDLLVTDGQEPVKNRQYAQKQGSDAVSFYQPNRNAVLPKFQTGLSVRWQRCAWRQACGLVQSWFANQCQTPPVLKTISIQASPNVIKLQKAKTGTFDYWLQVATLERGHPILLPVKLYKKAVETIQKYPCLFTGVQLEKGNKEWFLTLVVGKEKKKSEVISEVIGVDLGLKTMIVSSQGDQFGEISAILRKKVKKAKIKQARKQKLNVCLKAKGLPPVSCVDGKTERFVRNEAGHALNQLLQSLPANSAVALERLNVKTMKFKAKELNRWLRAGQLGFLLERLKFKLDEEGVHYRSVQPAYSSQECSQCGFVAETNRCDQAHFDCQRCGYKTNADYNAARNLAKRFGDDELNRCPFSQVKPILEQRFQKRLSVARSVTARLAPALPEQAVGQNFVYLCP